VAGQPIVVKFCLMIDLSPGRVFSRFGGDISRGLKKRGQEMGSGGQFGASQTHLKLYNFLNGSRRTHTICEANCACNELYKVCDTRAGVLHIVWRVFVLLTHLFEYFLLAKLGCHYQL